MDTKQELPRFTSPKEIINDPYFIGFVDVNIQRLKDERKKRPIPPPGRYYRRDVFDTMVDEGTLDACYFLTNIESIWNKKSLLSSNERGFIQFVCAKSFSDMMAEYEKQEKSKTE
jgi:hypothetical protein